MGRDEDGLARGSLSPEELRDIFSGAPKEVLARLVESDPLELEALVDGRLREHAVLLQRERLYYRAASRIALAASQYDAAEPLEPWLTRFVDHALDELLREDWQGDLLGLAPRAELDESHEMIAKALSVEPEVARALVVRFNHLAHHLRAAWFEAFVRRRGLDAYAADLGITRAEALSRTKEVIVQLLLYHRELTEPAPDGPEDGA